MLFQKINQTSKLEICMALFVETNPVKIMSLECIRFNLRNSVTCIVFIKDDFIRSILYKTFKQIIKKYINSFCNRT